VGILGGKRFVVAESGVGRAAAGRATEDVIKIHRPRWVVSAGFAGALVSDLHRGHMLMADSVMDEQRRPLEVGFRISRDDLAASPGLHVGRLLTVDQVIRHGAEKEALAKQYEAVACDMETIAVAQTCRRRRVGFLSVRIISDALDDTLPPEIERMLEQPNWAAKLGAATGAIFHRPASVKDMWRLRETALRMSDRLAQFLVGMLPQLIAASGDER
jgi:adenosylhomocysteine nucleosidase